MKIDKIFEDLGLSEREAGVYLACLKTNQATIKDIQKETKLSRTTVYYSLDILENEDLIQKVNSGKKAYYIASTPEKIKDLLEQKSVKLKESLFSIENLIPDLSSLHKKSKVLDFKTYKGLDSINDIFRYIYKNHKNETCKLFGGLPRANISNNLSGKILGNSINYRVKYNVKIRGISPSSESKLSLRKEDKKQLRESRFLPIEKYRFYTDILIFNDVVVFYTDDFNNESMIVTMEDKLVVETMNMIFDLAWEAAGKYDKEVVAEYEKNISNLSNIKHSKQ